MYRRRNLGNFDRKAVLLGLSYRDLTWREILVSEGLRRRRREPAVARDLVEETQKQAEKAKKAAEKAMKVAEKAAAGQPTTKRRKRVPKKKDSSKSSE